MGLPLVTMAATGIRGRGLRLEQRLALGWWTDWLVEVGYGLLSMEVDYTATHGVLPKRAIWTLATKVPCLLSLPVRCACAHGGRCLRHEDHEVAIVVSAAK